MQRQLMPAFFKMFPSSTPSNEYWEMLWLVLDKNSKILNVFITLFCFIRSSATRWTAYLQLWNQPNLQMKWKDERILISCNFLSNG